MKITFVCSGNTCRSPLAVAAWQMALREMSWVRRRKLARIEVASVGLHARSGARASVMAQRIARGWDADLSGHRAQVWRAPSSSDEMLVAMTREQAAQMRFRAGLAFAPDAPQIVILGAFDAATPPAWSEVEADQSHFDIPDPYGGSREAYEECGARILRGVRALTLSLSRQ